MSKFEKSDKAKDTREVANELPKYIESDVHSVEYRGYIIDLKAATICMKSKKGVYFEVDDDTLNTQNILLEFLTDNFEIIESFLYIQDSIRKNRFFCFEFEKIITFDCLKKTVKKLENEIGEFKREVKELKNNFGFYVLHSSEIERFLVRYKDVNFVNIFIDIISIESIENLKRILHYITITNTVVENFIINFHTGHKVTNVLHTIINCFTTEDDDSYDISQLYLGSFEYSSDLRTITGWKTGCSVKHSSRYIEIIPENLDVFYILDNFSGIKKIYFSWGYEHSNSIMEWTGPYTIYNISRKTIDDFSTSNVKLIMYPDNFNQ